MTTKPTDPQQPATEEPIAESRQGFALAGALLALVVVGALVTGSFFAASQEQNIGMSAKFSDEALYVAETALDQVSAQTTIVQLDALPANLTSTTPTGWPRSVTVAAGSQTLGTADVWVRRIGTTGDQYLFVAKSQAARGGQRYGSGVRALGLLTQVQRISFPTDRAMQLFSDATVWGNATVSGDDIQATNQPCSPYPDLGLQDAIVTTTSANVSVGPSAQIAGDIIHDPNMTAAHFTNYGGIDYDGLAALASIQLSGGSHPSPNPVGTSTTCDYSVSSNWGEPDNIVMGCKDYFPVIHVAGDLQITGNGRGQGILLVDGNIDIQGDFVFWGVTIAKGTVHTWGNGGHLNGTVMALGANLDDNLMTGNSTIQLSSCAVKLAASHIPGFNRAIPLRGHSWVDLSAADAGF